VPEKNALDISARVRYFTGEIGSSILEQRFSRECRKVGRLAIADARRVEHKISQVIDLAPSMDAACDLRQQP